MTRQPDFDRAAEMACRALVRMNSGELPGRPLAMLRRCRRTAVYTYEEAADHLSMPQEDFARRCYGADAFTIRGGAEPCYVVCYRGGGNPARLNFTLAHELGHILLGHREDGTAEEAEANCFAQQLLCPAPVLRRLAEAAPLTAERLAAACFVSLDAARARLASAPRRVNQTVMAQVEALYAQPVQELPPVGRGGICRSWAG